MVIDRLTHATFSKHRLSGLHDLNVLDDPTRRPSTVHPTTPANLSGAEKTNLSQTKEHVSVATGRLEAGQQEVKKKNTKPAPTHTKERDNSDKKSLYGLQIPSTSLSYSKMVVASNQDSLKHGAATIYNSKNPGGKTVQVPNLVRVDVAGQPPPLRRHFTTVPPPNYFPTTGSSQTASTLLGRHEAGPSFARHRHKHKHKRECFKNQRRHTSTWTLTN